MDRKHFPHQVNFKNLLREFWAEVATFKKHIFHPAPAVSNKKNKKPASKWGPFFYSPSNAGILLFR